MADLFYIEAPDEWSGGSPSVFLAGGITGCPDWQRVASDMLTGLGIVVLNPRRSNFPIDDPTASETQIKWEFRHLHYADAVMFWFPESSTSPQPIALYELGYHAAKGTPIAVGCASGYSRKADVYYQIGLARHDVKVRHELAQVVSDIERLVW